MHSTSILRIGDPAPLFSLPAHDGSTISLKLQAGHPILLVFYAQDEIKDCQKIAHRCQELLPVLNQFKGRLLSISLDAPENRLNFAKTQGLDYVLLSDYQAAVSQQYNLCEIVDNESIAYTRAAFLLDRNLKILKIYSLANFEETLQQIGNDFKTLLADELPCHLTRQAPILLIKNVLELELCHYLINVWETEGNTESGFMLASGEQTVGVLNPNHKIRRDHFIDNPKLTLYLDEIMQRRVIPEIKQAFQFEATRRETYKIACYDAKEWGFFRPHRDNTTGGTAHRKFAMTVNLNTEEYEGGFLRFSEYAPHLYKPDTGDAIIFSCSMLHEATDVTAGRRFAFLNFFYGEQESQARKQYENQVSNDYNNVIRIKN